MITRPHVEFVSRDEIEPRSVTAPFSDAPLRAWPLVAAVSAGNGAAIVSVPAGWRGAAQTATPYELIVLEGAVEVDGQELGPYGYVSAVPNVDAPSLASPNGALLFVDAIRDVTANAVVPFTDDGWEPGGMAGLTRKMIRGSVDGARGFFLRIPAGWSMELTEWHDCAEAALHLEGDLWHVRANNGAGGTMHRHDYFWRPRHVLHSPMGSEEGALSYVYVDGQLVNHYVEKGEEPPLADSPA